MISLGTTAASSRATVRLAETYPSLYAAVGIHPNSCAEAGPGDWDAIVACWIIPAWSPWARPGLDRYWDYAPIELQRDYFDRHLRLSQAARSGRRHPLPRRPGRHAAHVARGGLPRPLARRLHAFSGDAAMAAECLDLGLYVSFAGNVTYTNKKFQSLREAAATVPADRILIETDSPYLTPEPLRGKQKRNEPALVAHTAAALAALRGVPLDEFVRQTDGQRPAAVPTRRPARRITWLP